ncbi:hypothetical protein SLS58_007634 [Diplodia intermedia]|uniref:Uncharacterized protein n=1 Tax=Diplodia intermedia TaxID=856260 RepID=A0ABR3TK40_9PEZI
MSGPKQEVVVYMHSSCSEKPAVLMMTREQLQDTISANSYLRLSHKAIPRGHRHIEILGLDLIPEAEREACADKPNMGASIAAVTLPNRVWVQRQMANQFTELHILSVSSPPPFPVVCVMAVIREGSDARDVVSLTHVKVGTPAIAFLHTQPSDEAEHEWLIDVDRYPRRHGVDGMGFHTSSLDVLDGKYGRWLGGSGHWYLD